MPSFGNQMGEDPLGIGVQGRARDARQQQHLQDWGHPSFGPLADPKWDGLFQAMQEQGVGGIAGGNVAGSNAFVGQQHLSGHNGAGEMGPQGFTPATGQRGQMAPHGQMIGQAPIMGNAYQSQEQWMGQNAPMNGLQNAFKPPVAPAPVQQRPMQAPALPAGRTPGVQQVGPGSYNNKLGGR